MDVISNIWADWWWGWKIIMDLLVLTVLIRGIIGNKITDEVKENMGKFQKVSKKLFIRNERDLAHWVHERDRALKKGHNFHILDCQEGKCSLI